MSGPARDPHAALVAEAAMSSLKALRLAVEDLKAGHSKAWMRVVEEASTLGQCLGKIGTWLDEMPASAMPDQPRRPVDDALLPAAALALDRMTRMQQGHWCRRCGGVT